MIQEGKLFFNASTGRYDILFEDGSEYGGLHCGDCLDLLTAEGWKPTRIEYAHGDQGEFKGWYLVKNRDRVLDGLTVRQQERGIGRFICD
jgi:hypothetical protein